MVELIPQSPFRDQLPFSHGRASLTENQPGYITAIMPHQGKEAALSAALKKAHDLSLPPAGQSSANTRLRLLWAGRGTYFLVGEIPPDKALARVASLVDQSDGWCSLSLAGKDAAEVLARLCPLDLRLEVFKPGNTARSELQHIMALYLRTGSGFEIMVMRSFAGTTLHHLKETMKSVAAQNRITGQAAWLNPNE